jgi:DNA-binding IclR family transcriptional regulator
MIPYDGTANMPQSGARFPETSMKPARRDLGSRYHVPVLLSAFRVLHELSRSGGLTLAELTLRTGIAKSTVFRILATLHHLGYVLRDDVRAYHLSHSLAGLVSEVSSSDALRRLARPHMLRLRDQFGETVNLGQLQLDQVVYLEVVPSECALRLHERPGASVPVHASALGKAILAFSPREVVEGLLQGRELPALTPNTITRPEAFLRELQRVHAGGYALDREETMPLATCVGVPILDARGQALAALSISGPSARFHPRRDRRVIPSLLAAAEEISQRLCQRP